ncbi:hypothetical protein GNF09_36795 [Nostoc sp. UCD120]|nr:hypothetical protein [Nostoc sp. UCD120]
MQGVQRFFAEEVVDSCQESTDLINALTTMLAANEVKQANLASIIYTSI